MIDRSSRRRWAATLLSLTLAAGLAPAGAQSPPPKTVVHSREDLPTFTYPLSGSASELVQADPATFNAFAAKVKSDIDGVFAAYDIQDSATQLELLSTELDIDMLAGVPPATLLPLIDRLQALQTKPDLKLMTGVRTRAILQARADTGATGGPAYAAAFEQHYQAALAALPWDVVGTDIKEQRSAYDLTTAADMLGGVQASIDPGVAKTHSVSFPVAENLIGIRAAIDTVLPIRDQLVAALGAVIAQHNAQKPDIWAARDVTLSATQHLTPVLVGIWDSGVDISLYPHQVFTDPGAKNPHGFAYDLLNYPTTGVLYPLPADKVSLYPQFVQYFEGGSDLEAAIDSPAATAFRLKVASLTKDEVGPFFENQSLFDNYAHGTHVAGIAVRGNPAARIVVGRLTYDYKTIPTPPAMADVERGARATAASVAYFRAHRVRVVNMSWGEDPSGYESALEANGMGKDAAERKALAYKYFAIDRKALESAIASAPEILFVCAAGNSDSDATFDQSIPAAIDLPNLLVVGAVDQAGDATSFTSYGATVHVWADGYHVPSYVPGGTVVKLSGTSMASPNAANLAAKLLALDPKLTPAQVIKLIVDGATRTSDGKRVLIDPARSIALLKQRRG